MIRHGGTIVTGNAIAWANLLALRAAIKLEAKGIRIGRRSQLARVKQLFGLKGHRASILAQLDKIIEEAKSKIQPGEVERF